MKKSLLAVAAIGAFASAAQAQSSVTVYGILDVGFISTNNKQANNTIATNGGTVANSTTSQFGQNAESTSRLGFKGMEDLGGGLSAFFTIETAIAPQTQNAIQSNVSTSNRQTFAGLKKNGLGEFAIGTQYTTIHNAAAATDPGQLNNMQGNVIYDKAGFATPVNGTAVAGQSYTAAGAGTAATWAFSGNQDNSSYTVRANNMLSVKSADFAGFTGNAFYVMNNNNTNQGTVTASGVTTVTGGTTNNNGFGVGANYAWNQLLVTANYQQFTDKGPYAITNATGAYTSGQPVAGGFGGTTVYGTNTKDNQQYYAATYDFGILKAFAQYVNRKSLDVNNPNNFVARTAQQIGVRSYITPTIEAWASAGTGKLTTSAGAVGSNSFVNGTTAAGSNAANFVGYQLGSNYWLSKRTNLYAIYGNQSTNNQVYNTGTRANPTSSNSSAYALGVRHTF
jgi:predicted porin